MSCDALLSLSFIRAARCRSHAVIRLHPRTEEGDWRPIERRVVTLAVTRSRGEGQGFPIEPGRCSGMGEIAGSERPDAPSGASGHAINAPAPRWLEHAETPL